MFKPLYESLDAVSKESIQLFREYLIKNEQLADFEKFMSGRQDTRESKSLSLHEKYMEDV
ncbi:hypothetical protein ACS4RT_05855 [Bacillus amyloliquefaciens]